MVDLGLELLECSVSCQKRLSPKNGFATFAAPPCQGLSDSLLALVGERIVTPFVAHDAAAFGAWLGLEGRHVHFSLKGIT
jgi:hypothetical protein